MPDDKELTEKNNRNDYRNELKKLLKEALFFKEVTLSSGKKRNYYIDARLVTLSSKGSLLVAKILLKFLENYELNAVGGPTLGADPIIGGISVLGALEEVPLNTFIVRKKVKEHGRGRRIEGPSIEGKNVGIIDDVVTSGSSLIDAAQAAKEAEAKVIITTALVDREEGASDLIKDKGFKYLPIFSAKELL